MFDRIANTFVDSFVSRAEQVHGAALSAQAAGVRVAVAYSPAPARVSS